jgi:hypothetical protein
MRTCDKTGEAITEGWVFFNGEAYASTQEIADQIAQEYGYKDFNDLYESNGGDDDSDSYWTTWEEDDDDEPEVKVQEYTIEVKTVFTTCVKVKAITEAQANEIAEAMLSDGRLSEIMLQQNENSSEVIKITKEGQPC